jgi:DNA-3-methyladenine glycosylase
MLTFNFFDRDAIVVAKNLLGKVIRVKHKKIWLAAKIIETEAYYLHDKSSHAFLGYTEKRKALFMPAGTIYMYYARGKDSLNISTKGEGNAVLIKSAIPHTDQKSPPLALKIMQKLNPINGRIRSMEKLCSGQTLLCSALGLKVKTWDAKQFDKKLFYLEDIGYCPKKIIQTTRLGIPKGRDEQLLYRFVDFSYARNCTKKPCK